MRKLQVVRRPVRLSLGSAEPVTEAVSETEMVESGEDDSETVDREVGDLLDSTEIGLFDPLIAEASGPEDSDDPAKEWGDDASPIVSAAASKSEGPEEVLQIARPRTNTATVSASDRLAVMKKTREASAELRRTRKG